MDLNFRSMARAWRAGSKARAAKIGRPLVEANIPSIDEVEAHLKIQPLECTYCQRRLSATKAGEPQMDHRLPIARNGSAATHNLVLACKRCNQIKGNCTEKEFRDLLQLVSFWDDKGKELFVRLQLGFFR